MVLIPEISELQTVLAGSFGSGWKLLKHDSKYLTAPGENYGSTILALEIIYEENGQVKSENLVAKLCPPTDLLKEAFLTTITFKKETDAYIHACPAIGKFETEFQIPELKRLDVFAKCYGARMALTNNNNVDNDAVIILDNLKTQGYLVEDRMKGFDLETSKIILKDLARLHATIVAMRKLKAEVFNEEVLPCLETINNGGVMVDGFISAALTMASKIEECKPYFDKLKAMTDERSTYGGLLFPTDSNKNFYTIVHTDFWLNNILILRDEFGNPIKTRIIDFQLTDYGSPIRDLLFFLYTSVQIDVFDLYSDDLIQIYYQAFTECLLDYNCDLTDYSWEIFQQELNDVAPHELYHIIFMLKPIFSEKGTVKSLDDIKISDFGKTDNLGKVYMAKIKQIIIAFAAKGWF
ncbi:uncharacterized protein CBL_04738 [Carabus blaptoides fortunei]